MTVNTSTNVQQFWDKANMRFVFKRDENGKTGSVNYDLSDDSPPNVPMQAVGTRSQIQNCKAGRVGAGFPRRQERPVGGPHGSVQPGP